MAGYILRTEINQCERPKIRMNVQRIPRYIIGFLLNVLIMHVSGVVMGQGNLLVTPRRLVFEGARRTQELSLANAGNDTAKYSVSIVNMRMKDDGSFEEISEPDPGQNFASGHIRVFPRTIVLGPNEGQTIKVQLVGSVGGAQLQPGEYRSYVYFKALPREQMSPRLNKMVTNLSVKLVPVVGIAVPVIVKVGESTTKLSFSDLSFQVKADSAPTLVGQFNRTGNMSVYGDISVDFIAAETNAVTHVGVIKGLAIYTPNSVRKFRMTLSNAGVNYHNGKLHVAFTVRENERPVRIAEADLELH